MLLEQGDYKNKKYGFLEDLQKRGDEIKIKMGMEINENEYTHEHNIHYTCYV